MAYEMYASPVANGPQGQIIVMPQPVVGGILVVIMVYLVNYNNNLVFDQNG